MPKLNGIKTISAKSAQDRKVFSNANAVAAYNPVEHGIFLNKDVLRDAKTIAAYNSKAKKSWDYVLSNIDRLTGKQRETALLYKTAGRSLVGDGSVHDYIVHEMGHHIEWTVFDANMHNAMGKTLKQYAPRISGYANASTSEYIAESYSAYVKGEFSKLDPSFVSYLRKHSIDKPSGVRSPQTYQAIKSGTGSLKTLKLSKREYARVQHEIRTNLADKYKDEPIVSKAIGDYVYTFENNWPDDARIIGKVPIDENW